MHRSLRGRGGKAAVLPAPATAETNGRPHTWHIGSAMGLNDSRQVTQIGMRLALSSGEPQIRHGAGKNTDASALSVS